MRARGGGPPEANGGWRGWWWGVCGAGVLMQAHAHARTLTRTRSRSHAHAHAHTRTLMLMLTRTRSHAHAHTQLAAAPDLRRARVGGRDILSCGGATLQGMRALLGHLGAGPAGDRHVVITDLREVRARAYGARCVCATLQASSLCQKAHLFSWMGVQSQ